MTTTYRERIIRYVVSYMKRKRYQALFLGNVSQDHQVQSPADVRVNQPDDTKQQISEPSSIWAVEVFQGLFQMYPKFITLKMVMSVLRDKRVFEDVTDVQKKRFGRKFRLLPSIADEPEDHIVGMLLK